MRSRTRAKPSPDKAGGVQFEAGRELRVRQGRTVTLCAALNHCINRVEKALFHEALQAGAERDHRGASKVVGGEEVQAGLAVENEKLVEAAAVAN
jgi:hypothetical protein